MLRRPATGRVRNRPTDAPQGHSVGCGSVLIDKAGRSDVASERTRLEPDIKSPGRVELHVIWRETSNRLTVLHRRVLEGVDVEAASEFVRWLQFSGVVKLLEANPHDGHLRVDGQALRKQISDIVFDCGQRFNDPKGDPTVKRSELELIADRLAAIEKRLSGGVPQLSVVSSEDGTPHGGGAIPGMRPA